MTKSTKKKTATKTAPAKPAAKPACLCGCGRVDERMPRGLSSTCYSAARRLVAEGRTTWAALEAAGMALPAHAKRYSNPLSIAIMAGLPDGPANGTGIKR